MAAHLVGLAAQLTMLHTPRCPSLVSMVCCRALVGLVLGVAAAHTLVSTASWRSARAPPPLPALATHCTVVLPAPAASSVRCSAPRDRHHNRTAKAKRRLCQRVHLTCRTTTEYCRTKREHVAQLVSARLEANCLGRVCCVRAVHVASLSRPIVERK